MNLTVYLFIPNLELYSDFDDTYVDLETAYLSLFKLEMESPDNLSCNDDDP